jgi:hypothetical protein
VRFGTPGETERAARAELDGRIDEMFGAAAERERELGWWRSRVRHLWPGLDAERAEGGTLVVRSADRELTPLSDYVVSRAPSQLSLLSRRPACSFAEALSRARRAGVELARATARAGFTRGHLLEVVVHVPGGTGSPAEQDAVEAFVWDVLGERRADDWIGQVRAAAAPRAGPLRVLPSAPEPNQFPLSELSAAVDAAIEGLLAGLPETPLAASELGAEWTMFELTPELADEWADEDDLVMVATALPELLKCHLEKAPFSSVRFSRHGELFFCLKYHAQGSPEQRLKARVSLEDSLDRALLTRRAGRVIGAGLGLRYAYVHLALCQCELGLSLITTLGRSVGLPLRSWLLPFDSALAREWHEIWPDAPAPPAARRS